MQIYWGVTPVKSIEYNTTEDICNDAIDLVTAKRLVEPGDIVVMTAGIPSPTIKKITRRRNQHDENRCGRIKQSERA